MPALFFCCKIKNLNRSFTLEIPPLSDYNRSGIKRLEEKEK